MYFANLRLTSYNGITEEQSILLTDGKQALRMPLIGPQIALAAQVEGLHNAVVGKCHGFKLCSQRLDRLVMKAVCRHAVGRDHSAQGGVFQNLHLMRRSKPRLGLQV